MEINVGLVGYGTVGKGMLEILINNGNVIRKRAGFDIVVRAVADMNIDKNKDAFLSTIPYITKDVNQLLDDENIDIIVELIGGINDARDIIHKAIVRKKHIVTANKALLAMHGEEIFKLAEEYDVIVGFEGSVGGGIPIIRVLKEDLAVNNVKEIYGIVNGTANYILTKMEKEGKEFYDVLGEAQDMGYAESDPAFDVEGIDSAHKISIISSIAFCTRIPFHKIYTEGITNIKQIDIAFAKRLNCKIKLLAIAKKYKEDIEVRVHPTIIPDRYILSKVDDVYNAFYIRCGKVDRTIHYGRGAGGSPTGSAVVADIVSIARDIKSCSSKRVPLLGFSKKFDNYYHIKDINEIYSAFYLRFTVVDKPKVMSVISGILGDHNISIISALQRGELSSNNMMPLVFMTHEVLAKNIYDAVNIIDQLDIIKDKTVIIRVEQ